MALDLLSHGAKLLQLISLLLIVVPIFDAMHVGLSPRNSSIGPKPQPIQWLLRSIKILVQRTPPSEIREQGRVFRHFLIFSELVLPNAVLYSALPLKAQAFWSSARVIEGDPFSLPFAIAILFFLGLINLSIGFTFPATLYPLKAIEQFFVRQATVIVISLSCFSATISNTVHFSQAHPWGILQSPIAFCCAFIALTFFTLQRFENESVSEHTIRKPLESRMTGTLLIGFQIARNLEYLAIHSMIVAVFLAGPILGRHASSPLLGLCIFTMKLFALSMAIIGVTHLMPRLRQIQILRTNLLVLLPIALLSLNGSRWLWARWW